ncbi:hypothetical protein CONCODRAFT_6375 [Conidiobolus coronatus NRRL 28638]|uniref:Uncharacterized protein n=1 Tax=Conidiobolus coronatus (strain ATCC 28846 / CBS 209.66 / NRRL 28638) TaxID=796925 RepID=A0A137P7L8_CONC2|nr:hypothetical protein CONCODRAFT_6375 [Conidiobolus coronatus NRRL 28638]|eukprot:KXN71000.1 hypothetical protein CONCODRAFT_6375 [Conidiobolus coronatus NRRL 28638]
MKFQLILLASSLLAQPFELTQKAVNAQKDQLVGVVDSNTRTQLDKATEELNDAIKNLLGLELTKLQLLADKNGENPILKELKPSNDSEHKSEKKTTEKKASDKINFDDKKDVKKDAKNDIKKDEKKNQNGLVNDVLDVVTIPEI